MAQPSVATTRRRTHPQRTDQPIQRASLQMLRGGAPIHRAGNWGRLLLFGWYLTCLGFTCELVVLINPDYIQYNLNLESLITSNAIGGSSPVYMQEVTNNPILIFSHVR